MYGSPAVQRLSLLVLLLVSASLGGVGDIFVLQWARLQSPGWLFLGALLWIGALVLMGLTLRANLLPFSLVIVTWVLVHTLVSIAWDVTAIGARFSPAQWAGVALALVALTLLQTAKPQF